MPSRGELPIAWGGLVALFSGVKAEPGGSDAATELSHAGSPTSPLQSGMPGKGKIRAISATYSEARTAGTITCKPRKNGTVLTLTGSDLTATIDGTNTRTHTAGVAAARINDYTFNRDDRLSAEYATSGFTPVVGTESLLVVVWGTFDGEEFSA